MKIIHQTALVIAFFVQLSLQAQVITTIPTFPTSENSVVITYNSAEGNKALASYTGDIYAHTGVITNLSTSGTDWKYVIAGWTVNTATAKLTPIGNGLYTLNISPTIRSFYGVPTAETILKMAFVFRSADGTKVGRSADGTDIFVDVYPTGLNVNFELPVSRPVIVQMNEQINIKANALSADSLAIYIDDKFHKSTTSSSLSTTITANLSGKHWVKANAYANSGIDVVVDSFYYFTKPAQIIAALPEGIKDGINYINDNSVVLSFYAPFKNDVFAIGDFSDWQVNEDVYMKKTPDGLRYWIQIDNLIPGKPYIFQYLVDGKNKYADYYCDQVSDPWNDKYITSVTYPNLPLYPEGKTSGIASVFTTGQTNYDWKVTNFQKPKITDLVIYETLLRDFTTEHSYQSVIAKLEYLKLLGINAIELMPVNEFEGNLSWGYNPAFYFAPDKYYGSKNDLKNFIDACHEKGIAVILDMVLNHSYNSNPMVQMYWDEANNRPATNNPWFNVASPNTAYSWGSDFNHDKADTKAFVDRVNAYWINEYKVDGFRFDFTKGFTNTPGDGWAYDASRVSILKRMADKIWENDNKTYVILEHFADNNEEKELANYGMMVWGNMNGSFKEAHMGYTADGKSNIDWASYIKRGWSKPNLVVYMESHDEERQMVYAETWGNTDGVNYSIKNETTALMRMRLGFLFNFMIPGPKMLWQFEELGYDFSINYPSGTSDDRLSSKPVFWGYYYDTRRSDLYHFVSSLSLLKKKLDVFETTDFELDVYNALKRIKLNSNDLNIVALGNFDVFSGTISAKFQHTGTWYEHFSGNSLSVTDVNMNITLAAGEYSLYTDQRIIEADLRTAISDASFSKNEPFHVFPNPGSHLINLQFNQDEQILGWKVYSLQGKEILAGNSNSAQRIQVDISSINSGIYIIEVFGQQRSFRQKFIKR